MSPPKMLVCQCGIVRYVLLQKHTSEITAEDVNLATFILYNYAGTGPEVSRDWRIPGHVTQ